MKMVLCLCVPFLLVSCSENNTSLKVPYEVQSLSAYNKQLNKALVKSKLSDTKIVELEETSNISAYCIESTLVVTKGTVSKKDADYLTGKSINTVYITSFKDAVDATDKTTNELKDILQTNDAFTYNNVIVPCTDEIKDKLNVKGFEEDTIKSLLEKAGAI